MLYSLSGSLENKVGLVEAIKHVLAVSLESCSEQIVQVGLIGEVDSRDGRRASITLVLSDTTSGIDSRSDRSFDLGLGVLLPVLESRVLLHESRHPLVGVLDDVRVNAVLEILLHVCIEEQIKAGNIAEGHILSE